MTGLLRPGNAGSNTAADHVTVLGWALESLPEDYRPDPDDPGAQQILVRCDSAGATHDLRRGVPRAAGWGSPSATPSTPACSDAVEILNTADGWYPAIEDRRRHP